MANLLLNWLNDDVKLSQVVSDLDSDFRDGYLMGELMFRFNQQDNFQLFDRKFTPDSRIKNFCLLEPTIRRLGLTFNFALAFDIMKGKTGVIKALLAEIRAVLERIQKNSMPPIAPAGQRGQIMRVMRPGNERFDKSMSAAFEKSVRAMMDNPTEVILQQQVTSKFDAIGEANILESNEGDNQDDWEAQNDRTRKREVFEHRKNHEREFSKAWDMMNVEQWKKNQHTGHIRKLKEEKEVTDYETRKKVHFKTINDDARANTYASINAFDERLRKEVFREDPSLANNLGASLKKTIQAADGMGMPTLEYTDQKFLDAGLNLALQTMKEHHEEEAVKTQVHDRRRRKFIRERESAAAGALHTRAQEEVVQQLLNNCRSEEVESETRRYVLAQKEVMIENRVLRAQGVATMEAASAQGLEARAEELCTRENAWVAKAQERTLTARAAILTTAKSSAGTQRAVEFVQETVDQLLDLVDWTATVRHIGLYHEPVPANAPPADEAEEAKNAREAAAAAALADKEANPYRMDMIPATLWSDAKEAFICPLSMPEASMVPFEANVYEDLPYSQCERPMCVDLNWLLSKPFQTHSQMAPKGSLEAEVAALIASMAAEKEKEKTAAGEVASTAADAADAEVPVEETKVEETTEAEVKAEVALVTKPLVTTLPIGSEVPADRLLSEHLASVDCASFVKNVGAVEIEGYAVVPETVTIPVENTAQAEDTEGFNKNLVVTPEWLYTTAPQHLLGEVIIATSCAAVEVPEYPTTPLDIPPLPLRAALCSVSDVSRNAVSTALKEKIPDLAIINAEGLVHKACTLANDTLFAEAQAGEGTDNRTSEQKLAVMVLEVLQSGNVVSDELYTALVVNAVSASLPPVPPVLSEIEERDKAEADSNKTEKVLAEEAAAAAEAAAEQARNYPGFLLEDYPTTKQQSVMLFKAMSGISYDEDKPKPGDRSSDFASARPGTYERCKYDPSKCGLNKVFYVDHSELSTLTEERVHSRVDLRTGEIVQLDGNSRSIEVLQELYTPLRPVQTQAIENVQTEAEKDKLVEFLADMQLLNTYSIGKWDGDHGDRDAALKTLLEDVANYTHLFTVDAPPVAALTGVSIEDGAEAKPADASAPADDAAVAAEEAGGAADAEANAEAPAEVEVDVPVPAAIITPASGKLDKPVAEYLMGMWKSAERQSTDSIRSYFAGMRDIRYQMTQRRRGVHDVVQRFLLKRDERQEIFEDFRDQFNMIDSIMRFDNFVIGELSLRTLEMGRHLWSLSDAKKEEADGVLAKIEKDGMTAVHTHRCQVEGAALIQAELKRFLVSMHLLFDYTRGCANYDSSALIRNTLETCHDIVVPVAGVAAEGAAAGKDKGKGADKGKKGEAAAAVAWRNVVPPVILPVEMMQNVPAPPGEEPPVDPKAKGKPPAKGKGAVEEVAENPVDTMVAAALVVLAEWAQGTFTVQRAVYAGQEALCASIENTVWHEVERCKFAINQIKSAVHDQTAWIAQSEKDCVAIVRAMIVARHQKEYQVVHRLLHMIFEVIQESDIIRQIWVIDGDAVTVFSDKLCVPMDNVRPQAVLKEYPEDRLNDDQLNTLISWIEQTKTGGVLLEEDVKDMLIRALGTSSTGPFNSIVTDTSLMMPVARKATRPGCKLVVKLVGCKDLVNADPSGKSDPYCILRIQEQVHRSMKIENDLNPTFDYEFEVDWDGLSDIEFQAIDHDIHNPDDLIGSALIDLDEYVPRMEAGEVVSISDYPLDIKGEKKGTVTVEISLPVPLEVERVSTTVGCVCLPTSWRSAASFQALLNHLLPTQSVAGTDESVGYVDAYELINKLRNYSTAAPAVDVEAIPNPSKLASPEADKEAEAIIDMVVDAVVEGEGVAESKTEVEAGEIGLPASMTA